MATYLNVKFIRPAVIAILASIVVGIGIIVIGELLLNVLDPDVTSELRRPELWVGVALTVAILAVAAFLASRQSLGRLDDPVAVGSKPMSSVYVRPAPADPRIRYGTPGSVADIAPGFFLYARNGELAQVIDVLQSVEDVGGRMRTLLYAAGLHGSADEMWVPVEAVTAVYPEARNAFLAISGDEIEALGWNLPPASFRRQERVQETPLY